MEGGGARGPGEPAWDVAVERDQGDSRRGRGRGRGFGGGSLLLVLPPRRLANHLLREEPCEVDSALPELEAPFVDSRDEVGVGQSGGAGGGGRRASSRGDADFEDRPRREPEVDGVELRRRGLMLSFFFFFDLIEPSNSRHFEVSPGLCFSFSPTELHVYDISYPS